MHWPGSDNVLSFSENERQKQENVSNYHQKKKSNYHHLHQPIFFLSRGARRSGAIAQLLGVTCLLPSLSLSTKSATIRRSSQVLTFSTFSTHCDQVAIPSLLLLSHSPKPALFFSSSQF